MHCQNCGQEIIEGSDFCGNCGARIERHPVGMTCANCGSMCLPGEEFCTECGARLGGEPEPKQAFCTECGAPVEQGAVFCKECGAALNATTSPAQFVCPECGEPLSPDAVFCGNCGMSLQQGAEYDSAAPEATTAAEYQPSYPPETQNYSQQEDWAQQQIQPAAQEPLYDQQQEQNIVPQPQLSSRRKMLMAAAAAVILLVVGITGFWKPGFLLDLFRSTAKLENGTLALNDITLDFKQTNLSNGAATMTTVKDKEEEVQNGLIGDLYVMKIDKSCEGKVTVAVPVPKDFKPTTGNGRYIKLGIGRDYELEDGKTARRYSYFDAEIKDGKAVAIIDPAVLGQSQFKNKANEKPAEKASDKGRFTEYVGFFYKEGIFVYGEGYQYSKGHFRLWYDYHPTRFRKNIYMAGGDAQNLLNDLEEAYNYYKSHGYKDHVDTYTPIDVYITRQYGSGEGNEGAWDPITGNIELNESKVFDNNNRYEGATRTKTRATIYHEVFHAVQQSLIGGKAYITDSKKSNWFDEATGTNFERLVSEGLSDNENAHFWRLWQGPIPKESDRNDGYARGLLIRFMSNKLGGDDWIKGCYEKWSADCWQLKRYMSKIASTDADFAAKFYLDLVKDLGKSVSWYYLYSQRPSKDEGHDRFLSAIRLELDEKAKEKIDKGEEGEQPIVFTSPSFELEGYGGHVIALVTTENKDMKSTDLTGNFPDKCQLKLEAEGSCRIQVIRFKGNADVVSSNDPIIKKFKEQLNKKYLYLVLVTSTQPSKQNVVLKATLEKEELKEGIYNGKATMTQGKKTGTRNNVLGFRLTKGKDGKWGLNVCQANGDYMGAAANVPLTYDAKEKIWKGHRKFKEDVSKNPNRRMEDVITIDCTMKVNTEGKEPVLVVNYKTEGTTHKWGYPTKEAYSIKFEGKWSSELKGKNLGAKSDDKITILE